MLTIKNINKIDTTLGYDTWTIHAKTHYSFFVKVNFVTIEITLSRHTVQELYGTGHPHPHKDRYLMMCNINGNAIQYWLHIDDFKDMWNITRIIEKIINEVC